jgi:L-threonylcarbamoyladenylate synthase
MACAVLRQDGLVVMPTETVYGLAARLTDRALDRVFRLKQRPAVEPLPIQVADVAELSCICTSLPTSVAKLAERWIPGPLTLVLRAVSGLPVGVATGSGRVAVRISGHPVVQAVLRALAAPLAVTSANRHGMPSPTDAERAHAQLGQGVDMVLDAGPTQLGQESTVLDLTSAPPRILRAGAISRAELESVLGPLAGP